MIPQIFSNTCPLNSGHANYSIPIGQNIIFDCCLLVACCLLLMALFTLWQSNLNLEIAEKGPFWTISIDISQFDWCFSIKIVYKSWLRTSTRFERVKKYFEIMNLDGSWTRSTVGRCTWEIRHGRRIGSDGLKMWLTWNWSYRCLALAYKHFTLLMWTYKYL